MAQDFLELFSVLENCEVRELELFKFIKYTHSLIQSRHRDSIPNTLRKFYECFLYCCERENKNVKIYYHDDSSEHSINIGKTSHCLFRDHKEFYKNTVLPFLEFANHGSHCEGISYATVKKNEIYKNIGHVISLWNWYASNIRPSLKNDYSINAAKYSLPEPLDIELANLKNKLESKDNTISQLKAEKALLQEAITTEDNKDENVIDMDILEEDILNTIILFNAKNIYCTHRTVALFLLGDRIAQTDYCNFDEEALFKKYSDNKFSEFEYDLALKNLIDSKKIIQRGMYFLLLPEKSNIFTNLLLHFRFNKFKLNKTEYSTKIDEKVVKKIQQAISNDKKILVRYYKSIPNTNTYRITKRELKPLILIPKDKLNESETLDYSVTYSENLFYLRANDIKDNNKPKNFRLDKIKFIKYVD